MIFCIVSRSSFCRSSLFIPHSLSEFNSCFISLWPPSCPFLLFPPRRKLMLSLILLYGRKDRTESHASISLCIFAFSDVLLGPTMLSNLAVLPSPSFRNCRCVKAISLSRPQLDNVEVTLQLNSFIIPYDIGFLNPHGSLSHPCQHNAHMSLSSSLSSSSVHCDPNSTLKSR